MPPIRSIQTRYTVFLVLFVLVLIVLTVVGIGQLVAPKLQHTEEQVVLNRVAEVAEQIQGELNKVQSQQRSITQTIPLLDSDAIDKQREEAADRIEALSAENERLREAGKDLGFYAGHDDSCDCVKGWAKGPCNCGYTETWKQWSAALGETK